ncbi:hypothetical protein AGR2A_Lc70003 [Agrobacterium genomosp. 2 str. CFBP 5494]|uniref:Uncharacterized protein n=1 Tax=Agrobacterium genomosp. 2 str. CFBP 5494 TaxID=1183436 RepID=A0A9W5B5J3_9HYPH|nr:hypothetical protein AGR2A_Lc70003 [Agrobacterium genomosp. 2 str. CFBP 5494]
MSGLIREPHRTSQQAKFEKLRKFDKGLNLICYFGFLEMPADGALLNAAILHTRRSRRPARTGACLLLARFLTNWFVNEALTWACLRISYKARCKPLAMMSMDLTRGFESCTSSPEVSGERMTDGAQPV